jgi:hypothetical protein
MSVMAMLEQLLGFTPACFDGQTEMVDRSVRRTAGRTVAGEKDRRRLSPGARVDQKE